MSIVCFVLWAYLAALIVRIILDWVQVPPSHPVGRARDGLSLVTEPVLAPLRRVIPPLRLGGVALDLSVIVVLIGLQVIMRIIGC